MGGGPPGPETSPKGTSYPEGARRHRGAIMGPVASVERVPASLLPGRPSVQFPSVLRRS